MSVDQSSDKNEWADCPLKAETVQFTIRGQHHYAVDVRTEHHKVQVTVSPQGRSVRVYVDGVLQTDEPVELHKRAVERTR